MGSFWKIIRNAIRQPVAAALHPIKATGGHTYFHPLPTCISLSLPNPSSSLKSFASFVMNPTGTIVFSTVGRSQYGFDIFSVKVPMVLDDSDNGFRNATVKRLTDGVSINFNGQFVDDEENLVFVSERTGSPKIYLTGPGVSRPEQLPTPPESLFHDRPVIRDRRLFFVSAHDQPDKAFKSWSALYSTDLDGKKKIVRLTPSGSVDYSPAVSQSGKYIAVASYGSRPWGGEFHDVQSDIVVFRESDPSNRVTVCQHGGWPTWSDDSTIYFHRQADDGWWSIFKVDLPEDFDFSSESPYLPRRVTPPGLHCVTPAAMNNSSKLAVATRRRDKTHRHIEIFDTESKKFSPVTELLNPGFHCYNPFFSPNSRFLGYHRFRGESVPESTTPHIERVGSPIKGLKMLRLNGQFPSFSPSGDLIAFNHDFESNSGLHIIKSDGSKRWTLFKDRVTFYVSWSPAEKNVIFTSIGPIFESSKATVQIARVEFDPANLTSDRDEVPTKIKILTDEDTGNNAFPSCSPDGNFVVFRSGRSGHKNLYIIDAVNGEFAGGSIRQLTNGPWIDTMPSWSPDGKLIAFSSNMHNPDNPAAFSIYVIKPDGSDLQRIRISGLEGSEDRERLNHVCWSSDCLWLLFTANLAGVTADPVSLPNQFQPYGDLHLVKLDGSGLRRLTWDGYENGTPAWHPRGGDVESELESLGIINKSEIGDVLKGDFIEPLWLNCNI